MEVATDVFAKNIQGFKLNQDRRLHLSEWNLPRFWTDLGGQEPSGFDWDMGFDWDV